MFSTPFKSQMFVFISVFDSLFLSLDAAMQLNEDCSRGLAQTLRNMRSLQILK